MSLRIDNGFNGVTDPDAGAYIAAVEAADGQLLEFAVGKAINDFVIGCKADGTWNAIKASCILAGARTLSGALVPLVGTAPTNTNFVAGDYNRKTGLAGGSGKSINTNRNNNADPQNSQHFAVYLSPAMPVVSVEQNVIASPFGGGSGFSAIVAYSDTKLYTYSRNNADSYFATAAGTVGLIGVSRNNSTSFITRRNTVNTTTNLVSNSPTPGNITLGVFRLTSRYLFYSIGESLDLALLDTRVTALINALAAAIP